MGIRKNGSCDFMLCLALVVLVIFKADNACFADAITPAKVLTATYKPSPAITWSEAESAIASLQKALAGCKDSYLAFRIKYRIGILYYKAGMRGAAKARFLQLSNDAGCPELIRICSLNMVGQISRLAGDNKEASEAFDQVANLLERWLYASNEPFPNPALTKLLCSALFSRAEIYELQHDYNGSITEYNRLLQTLAQDKKNGVLTQYAPLACDRISQLHLRQGGINEYVQLAEVLTGRYAEYYRTPVIRLELESVKFLESVLTSLEFPNGSFDAPSRVIAYLKDSNSKGRAAAQNIVDQLDRLYMDYQNTYGGTLLQYHYACLLDTLGEKDKATEIFARISSVELAKTNGKSWENRVVESIRAYAKIQYAIMLGERADYNEALRVLGSLQVDPDDHHLSELAKSVSGSIEILKREVPKNEAE
jgi:tetratricopeptide (TPR) repeat protein